jgi:hypothetical protein
MKIGNLEDNILNSTVNLGFEIVSKITLLSYVVSNDEDTIFENFFKVKEKIKKY